MMSRGDNFYHKKSQFIPVGKEMYNVKVQGDVVKLKRVFQSKQIDFLDDFMTDNDEDDE